MTKNEKREALKELQEDLNSLRRGIIALAIEETDSDRLDGFYRDLHDLTDIEYHLAFVQDFLEPLYR